MLDNNEYVPYEFEPVEEAEPPRKKKHIALKVTALALVCAIAGGAGGAGLTAMMMNSQ